MYKRFVTSRIFSYAICLALVILSGYSHALESDVEFDNRSTPIVFTATPLQTKTSENPRRRPTLVPSEVIKKATEDPLIDLTCKSPSEDYSRIEINGYQLNQRTFEMLQRAQILYGGDIDITGEAITQKTEGLPCISRSADAVSLISFMSIPSLLKPEIKVSGVSIFILNLS